MSKIKKTDLLQLVQEQAEMIAELSGMVELNKRSIIKLENEREKPQLKQLDQSDDIAKELLEVDLSSELTGSDYYYSKSVTERLENGQELIMCFVSNVSESDAMQERHVEVITSVDTELNDTDGCGWQYAVPINNQGEPLTAAEAGL